MTHKNFIFMYQNFILYFPFYLSIGKHLLIVKFIFNLKMNTMYYHKKGFYSQHFPNIPYPIINKTFSHYF